MLKINKYFLSVFLLCAIPVAAQVNTLSPYSRFGLGEMVQPGLPSNLAMGGTGIGIRSGNQINYLNPASYSELDTMSFFFDFGINGSQTTYTTNTLSLVNNNFNFHHLAIGFGITRNWKSSIGVVPYSSVGYDIERLKYTNETGRIRYGFLGNGGLNKFYFGNSFRFLDHFSIGLNLSYLFGFIDYENSVSFPVDNDAAATVIDNRLDLGGMTYNFGFQYHNNFGEKYFLTLGAIFDNEAKINTDQTFIQKTLYPGKSAQTQDSILVNPIYIVTSESNQNKTIIPPNFGIGTSFGIKNKLIIAADYKFQDWSKAFIPGKNDTLVKANSMNFGIEYTPNDQALRGIQNRIHYRLGGYYSDTYLRIRGEQINDYGISFGVGIPFRNTRSSFNLGFVFGQRGTLNSNLIKENYGIFNIGLTLHDFWFYKRKFD
jgi:hypothetical protein